jgi:hypothetical protein
VCGREGEKERYSTVLLPLPGYQCTSMYKLTYRPPGETYKSSQKRRIKTPGQGEEGGEEKKERLTQETPIKNKQESNANPDPKHTKKDIQAKVAR